MRYVSSRLPITNSDLSFCRDQVSDAILDACLTKDPLSKVSPGSEASILKFTGYRLPVRLQQRLVGNSLVYNVW